MTDGDLLERYWRERRQAAFAEVVWRHVDMAHAVAGQALGRHAPLAAELTRQVFAELAREAVKLSRQPSVAGWLYTRVRRVAADVTGPGRPVTPTVASRDGGTPPPQVHHRAPDWGKVDDSIDRGIERLREPLSDTIILRYLEALPLAQLALRLGISPHEARAQLERASDQLRRHLSRRGLPLDPTTLALALAQRTVRSSPGGLAAIITAESFHNRPRARSWW